MPADDAATQIADHNITRTIFLERWGDRVARRLIPFINRVVEDILNRLVSQNISAFQRGQLESLIVQLDQILRGLGAELTRQLEPELRALVAAELASQRAAMVAAEITVSISALTAEQVYAAALADPFRGRFLRDWFASIEESIRSKVTDAIRIGYIEGQTSSQIARELRRTALFRSQRDAVAVVRTALTHFRSRALREAYKSSDDIGQRYRWLSVLDSRTTPICQGRSNKIYRVDSGPLPPAHWQCRSTITPIVKGVPNPEFTSYTQWLRRQPRDLVDDILGPARAKLFIDGRLPVDRFVNVRTGRVYTLEELARREAEAWRRAGLDEAA